MTPRIYVATHKAARFPDVDGYIPIHNGRACSSDLGIDLMGDDTGDNISEKMPTFSECCTMYWIWKNEPSEVVGLAHYRRYFRAAAERARLDEFEIASPQDFSRIGGVDLIVAQEIDLSEFNVTVEQQYGNSHFEKDMHLMRGAIRKLEPGYLDACEAILRGTRITPYNIFVGKKSVFSLYCEWLFPIMFLLESWISWRDYPIYQKRVISFLSERLFTIWIERNADRFAIERRPVIALPF